MNKTKIFFLEKKYIVNTVKKFSFDNYSARQQDIFLTHKVSSFLIKMNILYLLHNLIII